MARRGYGMQARVARLDLRSSMGLMDCRGAEVASIRRFHRPCLAHRSHYATMVSAVAISGVTSMGCLYLHSGFGHWAMGPALRNFSIM